MDSKPPGEVPMGDDFIVYFILKLGVGMLAGVSFRPDQALTSMIVGLVVGFVVGLATS